MTKGFTMEQIEKAQEFAKFFAMISDAVGHPDMALTKEIFNLVNGISENTEDDSDCIEEENEISKYINGVLDSAKGIFSGEVEFLEANVINCCKCHCK